MKNRIIFLLSLLIIFSFNITKSYTDLYFCTASDFKYFDNLLNLVGSIHKTNFEHLKEIAVFDLGLTEKQLFELSKIQKLNVYKIEKVHPDIIKPFTITGFGKVVPGWYAWKPVAIKQALDMFPYVLWIDAGTTVLKPLNNLFRYIKQNGYFLSTIGDNILNGEFVHSIKWQTKRSLIEKFELNRPHRKWILNQEAINASLIGVSKKAIDEFIKPLYELAKDIKNYEDDGTTPEGFGTARHDQALLALLAYTKGLKILRLDFTQTCPIYLNINAREIPFNITWNRSYVCDKTDIYCSRLDLSNLSHYLGCIKYKN